MVCEDMRIDYILDGGSFKQVSQVRSSPVRQDWFYIFWQREKANNQTTSSSIRYPILRRPSQPRKRISNRSRRSRRCCLCHCKGKSEQDRKSKSGKGGSAKGLIGAISYYANRHLFLISIPCSNCISIDGLDCFAYACALPFRFSS